MAFFIQWKLGSFSQERVHLVYLRQLKYVPFDTYAVYNKQISILLQTIKYSLYLVVNLCKGGTHLSIFVEIFSSL